MGACLSKASKDQPLAGEAVTKTSIPETKPVEVEKEAEPPVVDDVEEDVLDYIPPPLPGNEDERVKILRSLGILDTDREGRFDNITQLLCAVFDVPIAAVSLRQWFKAIEGLGDVCQTGRDVSFCGWTILPQDPRVMIVEDALKDVRFAGNPLVAGPPFIRFYAGAPLISSASDYKYGSLCVIDTKPHHEFTADQYNMLAQFAELVVREIEKDKLNIVHKIVQQPNLAYSLSGNGRIRGTPTSSSLPSSQNSQDEFSEMPQLQGLSRAADCFRDAVLLVNASSDNWQVLYANAAFATTLGLPRDEATAQGFWDMFEPVDEEIHDLKELTSAGESFKIAARVMPIYRRTSVSVVVDFQPAATGQLGPMLIGIPTDINLPESNPSENGVADGLPNGNSSGSNGIVSTDSKPPAGPAYYFSVVRLETGRNSRTFSRSTSMESGQKQGTQPIPAAARPTSPASLLPLSKAMPSAFNDVKLGPLIGRGAYGRVYRGIWNGNTVAVKVMETSVPLPSMNEEMDPSQLDRSGYFEALLSSHLSHPNVVHTYQYAFRPLKDTASESDRLSWEEHTTAPMAGGKQVNGRSPRQVNELWLISEYCNRGPLLTAVERGAFLTSPSVQTGQPNLVSVLQTCQEIAAAMQYLHSNNIVHGDLTGGNVLLTASEKDARGFTAKVVDFGLSRVCTSEYLRTKTLGCAEYMPPELITDGLLAKPADVYAFGVIMWEIYVGKRAWDGLKPTEVLKRVAGREKLAFPAQTPHRLKILGERCMDYDPSQRPTFVEVLSEVNDILSDTMNILAQFLASSSKR